MKSILNILRNTDQPVLNYLWRAWLIAFVPTVVISLMVEGALWLFVSKGPSPTGAYQGLFSYLEPSLSWKHLSWVVGAILVCPWGETLLMWPALSFFRAVLQETLWVATASALLWGYIHSKFSISWGLTVLWPFFVFSLCFLEWQKKSTTKAVTVTALIHTGQNLAPVLLLELMLWR
jgi:hypothetical protein